MYAFDANSQRLLERNHPENLISDCSSVGFFAPDPETAILP